MEANILISDIQLYFWIPEISTVEVNKKKLKHYKHLPAEVDGKEKNRRIKAGDRFAEMKMRSRIPGNQEDLEFTFTSAVQEGLKQEEATVQYVIEEEISKIKNWQNIVLRNYPDDEIRHTLRKYLELLNRKLEGAIENQDTAGKAGTTAQQVLAMHYVFKFMQVRGIDVNLSAQARFIEFLTERNYQNIYEALQNPTLNERGKQRINDLRKVQNRFEDANLHQCARFVIDELSRPLK